MNSFTLDAADEAPSTMLASVEQPITTLDLFAGVGGLTAGFKSAEPRFLSAAAVELEPRAAAGFEKNHPEAQVFTGDIRHWLRETGSLEVDVVLGGPPCQGFSTLGRQLADDMRNQLWRPYAEAVRKANPKFFVMENVPGFVGSPEFSLFWEQLNPGGKLAEYDADVTVLNAVHFGAPQLRQRAFVIGTHKDLSAPGLPEPIHTTPEDWKTVRQAIGDLLTPGELPRGRGQKVRGQSMAGPYTAKELHVDRGYQEISRRRFRAIPAGGNRFHLPEELQCTAWRRHSSGSGDVMGRLHWDRPSVTIRTEFTKPEKGRYLHPVLDRAITPYEGALLQGMDPEYMFVGPVTEIVKQIGNAVPKELGQALGTRIAARVATA